MDPLCAPVLAVAQRMRDLTSRAAGSSTPGAHAAGSAGIGSDAAGHAAVCAPAAESTARQATPPQTDVSNRELTWDDVPQLMDELQDLAKRLLRRWPGTDSLQPTLLVDTA